MYIEKFPGGQISYVKIRKTMQQNLQQANKYSKVDRGPKAEWSGGQKLCSRNFRGPKGMQQNLQEAKGM